MSIAYRTSKDISAAQLEGLFRAVGWLSGNYPERLHKAIRGSDTVLTAWDGTRLVGLMNAIDDGELTAYVHYLLVRPEYQKLGTGRELTERMKKRYEGYLYLLIIAEEKKTVPFYEKLGFTAADGAAVLQITTL